MNKFELINTVLTSGLRAEDKTLLIELVMRSDDNGYSWPSVERLCKVRGIKHEKNFKGADFYLPGLVAKVKKGRKNTYTLDVEAIKKLGTNDVTLKHTPAVADNTPSVAGVYTPAVADNTPSVAGANSTSNNTRDSTSNSTQAAALRTTAFLNSQRLGKCRYSYRLLHPSPNFEATSNPPLYLIDLSSSTATDTPATAGVLTREQKACAYNMARYAEERALVPTIDEDW